MSSEPAQEKQEEKYHPAELAALSSAAMRTFVIEKHEKGEIKIEPSWVLDRCRDAEQSLDRCVDYINFLEDELEALEEQNDGLRSRLHRKKRKQPE